MISVLILSFLFNVECYRLEITGARKNWMYLLIPYVYGRIDIVVF